jgi:hypothetical protein
MRRAPSFPRSPRVRPFWRSRTQELVDMANSGLQVSSTGLVVSDQGLVVTDVSTGDACCCGATGATCGICSGSTPATWALTFGSVALSTACFHVTGDPGSAKITSGTTFSGTFTVTQNGSFPCQWEYDAPYSGVVAEWWSASTTCGGASTYTSDRINVVMTAAFGGVSRSSSISTTADNQPPSCRPICLMAALPASIAARTIPALRTASPPMLATVNLYSTLAKTAR